jgi:CRISPR system Cascade subunit CasA
MTHSFSFNLVDEPWLPCTRLDGTAVTLSLRDVLSQCHQLQSLAGDSSPQTAALHRFLLAILHRMFGPADYNAWAEFWQAGQFDALAIHTYLDEWRHRFDLFDEERPFYQSSDPRVKSKSTISLSHDRASGNNATLFDHHTETGGETLTPAQAARVLITAQAYGLAGLSGITQKFTDGTCAGGIIFLVEGDNLRQTLLLNMIMYPASDADMFGHTRKDAPAWEMDDPFTPAREHPFGYLDYLTWQNRRVLLQPELLDGRTIVRSMTMRPALRLDSATTDPMKHYRIDDKRGALATSFSENRVLWRDSAAFFTFHDPSIRKMRPPATFRWLRDLTEPDVAILDKYRLYRCVALGMSKDQAKVFFFREERLPLPLLYLTDETLVNHLRLALDKTGITAFDLLQAVRRVGMFLQIPDADNKQWGELNSNTKDVINGWVNHTGVDRHYWSRLDIPFQTFIVDLAQEAEPALLRWYEQLRAVAQDAFSQAAQYVGSDGRSFKAIARGQSYLNYRLNQLIPQQEEIA